MLYYIGQLCELIDKYDISVGIALGEAEGNWLFGKVRPLKINYFVRLISHGERIRSPYVYWEPVTTWAEPSTEMDQISKITFQLI